MTHIYVARRSPPIEPNDRPEIFRSCKIVDRTIIERSGTTEQPWQAQLPVLLSAPHPSDNRAPAETYQAKREHVRRASGLILLGGNGHR